MDVNYTKSFYFSKIKIETSNVFNGVWFRIKCCCKCLISVCMNYLKVHTN